MKNCKIHLCFAWCAGLKILEWKSLRFCGDPAVVTCSLWAAAPDPGSFYLPTQKQVFRFTQNLFVFTSPLVQISLTSWGEDSGIKIVLGIAVIQLSWLAANWLLRRARGLFTYPHKNSFFAALKNPLFLFSIAPKRACRAGSYKQRSQADAWLLFLWSSWGSNPGPQH